jgi:serine/threonine-protein kinase
MTTLKKLQTAPPVKIKEVVNLPIPDELIEICETAMARNPNERYASANELALAVAAWLDGSRQRQKALSVVLQAQEMMLERQRLKSESEALIELAEAGLKGVPSWADENEKSQWWEKQQQAIEKQEKLRRLDIEQEQLLQAALTHKSDLEEAHHLLIERYRRAHERAELSQDKLACERHAIRLKHHSESLPESSPIRAAQLHYLKGTGALSLQTDVPDVSIFLDKYVPHHRRLVAKEVAALGSGPVVEYPLEMGSYRVRLKKIGYHDVVYPVRIGRGEHWDGIDPFGLQQPVHMPKEGSIGVNESYVPAGWFWAGGGNEGEYTFKPRRVWKDSFVMQTFPVTNKLYLRFLNDLVDSDRLSEALEVAPRERSGQSDQQGSLIYARDDDGRFTLGPDAEGDLWGMEWPVCLVDWHGAAAFAEWSANQTGLDWKLPDEMSWEKAARGVDGRSYPWGADFDSSYACTVDSHRNRVGPQDVNSFPVDASVYGVRGLAGNMMDWTSSPWKKTWNGTKDEQMYCIRGGSCGRSFAVSRSANRFPFLSSGRTHFLSFRLIRTI